MDMSMDIDVKSVDMNMDMDAKFHYQWQAWSHASCFSVSQNIVSKRRHESSSFLAQKASDATLGLSDVVLKGNSDISKYKGTSPC